ncbi:YrzI family small protein [Neobacillus niacini]|uniref:YrzI family small protein n=1 Tax=Neobacillus niacini TaxID=86668 RepID=UPI0030008A1A
MPQGECCPAVFLCLKFGRKGVISCGLFASTFWIYFTILPMKGCDSMTLNIFFISITFKKRQESLQQATRNEMVEKLYEQHKDRQVSMYHLM